MYTETAVHINKHEAYVEVNQSNRHGNIHLRNLNILFTAFFQKTGVAKCHLVVLNISYYMISD